MFATQDTCDFFDRIICHIFGECRGVNSLQVSDGQQTFHYCSIGCQYNIVLVHAHRVISLGFEYTYYTERYFIEANNFSNRIGSVREKVIGYCFSDDADFGRALYICFGEHLSVFYIQLADFEIIQSHATNGGRIVIITIDKLSGRRYIRTDS